MRTYRCIRSITNVFLYHCMVPMAPCLPKASNFQKFSTGSCSCYILRSRSGQSQAVFPTPMMHIQTNIHSFPTCFVVLYDWTYIVFIVYTAPITGKTALSFTGKYLPAYDRLFKRDGRKSTENYYGKWQLLVFYLLIYSYKKK